MKLWQLANLAASCISSSVASSFPYAMFLAIVVENRDGSY
jgi:hypothetical protein